MCIRDRLNATTEERSKIFRKLFRTQRYQKLQEALAEENSALTARRAALNAKLDAVLAGISYDAADPEAEVLGALSAQMPPDAVTTLLEAVSYTHLIPEALARLRVIYPNLMRPPPSRCFQ